jgi:carbamoyl-phosphate synthase large subunit
VTPPEARSVLITSASRKVALVRAFQDALQRTGGGEVVAADVDPLSAALYVADGAELVPPSDRPEFIEAIAEICARRDVGLIVPSRDEELPVLAAAASRLREAGVIVAVSEPEVVRACQDKAVFQRICASHGLGVPRTYALDQVEYPAFVRPRIGKGGRGTAVIHDSTELDAVVNQLGRDVIVQEVVDAPEYTIDLLADFSGAVVSLVVRRRVLVVGGESWVGRVEMRGDLLHAARRLAGVMRFRGHVTVQCFLADSDVLFIEVNPRFGGGAALGWAAGAPTPEYLVRLARGEEVRHDPDSVVDGLTMLRHTGDVFVAQGGLVAARNG